ncbi:MAG: helix-turn-helix domain-containing protein [Mogibacterium sp.]|nr:helix-turn-helix domain-containing protein [Mogibacterium sp.]MBR3330037.1 helix-turn-helix domain-containing protein [Mogibacterium sp.]
MYTIRQIAEKYQFNKATVTRWIKSGKLEGQKINAQWRVTEEALQRFISTQVSK